MKTALPPRLGDFARRDVTLAKGDPRWTTVADWQRQGLVRLEWTAVGVARIVLTDKGRAMAEREE